MKMSPRISGVTRFVFGGGTTGACPVREPSRKSVCGDEGWAAARNAVRVKHAKLNDTKLNLETIVGLPEVHRLRWLEYLDAGLRQSVPQRLFPAHLLKYTPNFVQKTLFLGLLLGRSAGFGS